jgi:hypothetical protein
MESFNTTSEKLPINNLEVKDYSREEVESILEEKRIDIYSFLKEFQENGYLLHGSPNGNIDTFEPMKPGDNRGGWTSQEGVYATSKIQPIFFAIVHRDGVVGSTSTQVSRDREEITYRASRDIIEQGAIKPGWVYIFEKKGFSPNPNGSGEWVNPNPVKPLGKVPVEPEDLDHPIEVIE